MPLLGGKFIKLGTFTFVSAVQTLETFNSAMRVIFNATDPSLNQPVTRVNKTGLYGMYRFGNTANVTSTVRLTAKTSYDPAVEYYNQNGTQASIGFSIEEDRGFMSHEREAHRSPLSIRIDNEGDTLALDIGSILGKKGTLGKRVADIIAIGDAYRSVHTPKTPTLNHNSQPYKYSGMHEAETFARIASEFAERLERRVTFTVASQLALKQTVAS